MALTLGQKVVSSKIDILEEQISYLQRLVHDAGEVLQLATSWLKSADGTNKITFKDINKIIEDKLVFLSERDFSVGCQEIIMQKESTTTRTLPIASTSTDQPLLDRYDQVSVGELKTIMSQVKVIQDAMPFLSTNTEKISEKQSIMEQSLSTKNANIEQEQIREITEELKNISEEQKKQDKRMKSFDDKIQAITDIKENQQMQKTTIKEQKKENYKLLKQSEKFTNDVNAVQENIQELNVRICLLESQKLIDTKQKASETNSGSLSAKFEEQYSLNKEFTIRTEETLTNLSSIQGRECERLQKFEEKISALEMSWNKTAQEAGELQNDVKAKYQMMCQIVDDRLVPLEKLSNIFNENLDVRKENMTMIDSVSNQMAGILSKLSQLEKETQRQAIGFSAGRNMCLYKDKYIRDFTNVFCNVQNHFDTTTGTFTAPLNGLYATYLHVSSSGTKSSSYAIVKLPCTIPCHDIQCDNCRVGRVTTSNSRNQASIFKVIKMKAGETLSIGNEYTNEVSQCLVFTSFRIG